MAATPNDTGATMKPILYALLMLLIDCATGVGHPTGGVSAALDFSNDVDYIPII